MAFDGAEPTATAHFEKVLDFPSGLAFPQASRRTTTGSGCADSTGDELWRSTVANPTTTAHFGESPRLPLRAYSPTRHHVACNDRLWVADATAATSYGVRRWLSRPLRLTSEKVLDFPSGLNPSGITSHATTGSGWRTPLSTSYGVRRCRADHYGSLRESLDFPSGLIGAKASRRMWTGFGWRTTRRRAMAFDRGQPTATAHFEKLLDFPSGLTGPSPVSRRTTPTRPAPM